MAEEAVSCEPLSKLFSLFSVNLQGTYIFAPCRAESVLEITAVFHSFMQSIPCGKNREFPKSEQRSAPLTADSVFQPVRVVTLGGMAIPLKRVSRMRCLALGIAATILIPLGGCSGTLSGSVVDGDSFRPVAGAKVTLEWRAWGSVNGQMVWDAPKFERTKSDAKGHFLLKSGEGLSLTVEMPGYGPVQARLCPRASRIFIGGPYPGARISDVLLVPVPGRPLSPEAMAELGGTYTQEMVGVRISGDALVDGNGALRIEATGNRRMAFVHGTGNIPSASRANPAERLSLDVPKDCGWAFIMEGGRAIGVIETSKPGRTETADGIAVATLQYTALR